MANILVELHQLVICYYRELNCIQKQHRIENWIQFMQNRRRRCGPPGSSAVQSCCCRILFAEPCRSGNDSSLGVLFTYTYTGEWWWVREFGRIPALNWGSEYMFLNKNFQQFCTTSLARNIVQSLSPFLALLRIKFLSESCHSKKLICIFKDPIRTAALDCTHYMSVYRSITFVWGWVATRVQQKKKKTTC